MTPVRVVWLSPWLRPLARVQVEALIARGHDVLLVTSSRHPEPVAPRPYELVLDGGPKTPSSWQPTLDATRRVRRFAPDVVVEELVRDPRWTRFAPGVPRVTLVHDDRPHGADEQRPRWERALFDRRARTAQGTVAFSDYVAGHLRGRGAPAVHVVPLTSDLPDDAVPPPITDRRDFVVAGRLRAYKNLEVALAAWRVHLDGPAWAGDELLLVGEGATPALPPHVRHLDGPFRYADVVPLLARAKGSLVHYRQASQSGVQVLSMQLGVVPIVSPCGALPEFQPAGSPPVGVDDVAGLAVRLDELAAADVAVMLGERARVEYRARFAVDAIVSRWEEVLRAALTGPGTSTG